MALKNYHIHRDLDKRELKKALGYALILVVFFAMVLFYIRQSVLRFYVENEINRKILLKNRLLKRNKELRLEREFLISLPRIEMEAKNRLGLIDPEKGQVIIINTEELINSKKTIQK